MRSPFLAPFGENEHLVWPCVVGQLNVVELFRTVPVEPGTPDVLAGFGVVVCNPDAIDEQVAVVVPDDNLDMTESRLIESRAEIVTHEVPLFFSAVNTGVPRLGGGRFILDRHAPNRHTFLHIFANIADVIIRPRLSVFRLQPPTSIGLSVRFHPSRRTPRRRKQLNRLASHPGRLLDQGEKCMPVTVNREMLEPYIAIDLGIRVIAKGEVTAVDVSPAEGISVTVCGIKIRLKKTLSILGTQLVEGAGSGFREGTTKTFNCLKTFAWINQNER